MKPFSISKIRIQRLIGILLLAASLIRGAPLDSLSAEPVSAGTPPKVWHMELAFTKITESERINNPDPLASSKVTIFESFNPLKAEFDIGPGFKMIPGSLKADYHWIYHEKQYFKGNLLFSTDGDESGAEFVEYSISLARRVRPAGCERILDAIDDAGYTEQKDNTIALEFSATIPGRNENINYDSGEKTPDEMRETLSDGLALPYRYDQSVNGQTDLNLMPELPRLGIVNIKKFDYLVSYRLTASKLRLEYLPLAADLIGTDDCLQVGRLSHRQDGEPFLAKSYQSVDGIEKDVAYFIHGNSQIIVWVDGVDQSRYFKLVRLKREWESPEGARKEARRVYRGDRWRGDTAPGKPSSCWMDLPGQIPPGMDSLAWAGKQYLQEYLVAVHEHPEFGFLYFICIVDTSAGRYRVRMSEALPISAETWCLIKKSNQPYRTAETLKVQLDSGLKTPW